MTILILLAVLAGLALLVFIGAIINAAIREKKVFYTPAVCDICGKDTGFKGNKRFDLLDGYICQPCAEKFIRNPNNIDCIGPRGLFVRKTIREVTKAIQHREEIGEEQWQLEMKVKEELEATVRVYEKIHAKPSCPLCGSEYISANQQGFNMKKAALTTFVFNSALAGAWEGGKHSHDVIITCLKCGHQWKPGQ